MDGSSSTEIPRGAIWAGEVFSFFLSLFHSDIDDPRAELVRYAESISETDPALAQELTAIAYRDE